MVQSYDNGEILASNYKESGIQLYTEKKRNIDKKEVALRLPLLVLAELDIKCRLAVAKVAVLKEIFRQQTHIVVFQSMVVQQTPYIDIDARSDDLVKVKLEMGQREGINVRVVTDEVWSP